MADPDGLKKKLEDIIKEMGAKEGDLGHLGGSDDTPSSWVKKMDQESKDNLLDSPYSTVLKEDDKSPLIKVPPPRVGAEWGSPPHSPSQPTDRSLPSLRSDHGDQRSIPKSMEFPSYQGASPSRGSPSHASELENLPLLNMKFDQPIMRKKFLSRSEGQLGLTERGPEPLLHRLSNANSNRLSRISFKSSVLADFDNQDIGAISEEENTKERQMFATVTKQNKEDQAEPGGVSCFYSVLVVIVNVAYMLIGAVIFMKYENEGRAREMEHDYETKVHLQSHLQCQYRDCEDFLNRLLLLQQSMCKKGNDKERGDWTYIGAFTFANTIITSIGYGLVSPGVPFSRCVTIGYALLGLPLYLLYLSYFDDFLNQFFNQLFDMMKSVFSLRMTNLRKNIVKALILVVVLVVMLITNTVCVFRTSPLYNEGNNNDFSTFDAIYWQIIRLTTIGFGDIVRYVESPLATVIITMFLLPVGLCVMSAYIQILRSLCGKRKIRVCCKNTKQDLMP